MFELLRVTLTLVGCILVSSCAVSKKWSSGRPDDQAYKDAGYGKMQSFYVKRNLEVLEERLSHKAETGSVISRNDLLRYKAIFLRSQAIAEYQNTLAVKTYINGYKKAIASEKPFKTNLAGASEKEHFDENDYVIFTPVQNVNTLRRLKKVGRMAMTESMAKKVETFYASHGIKTGTEDRATYEYYHKKDNNAPFASYGAANYAYTQSKQNTQDTGSLSTKTRLNAYLLDSMYEHRDNT